ncbi:hypothetical protein K439DRAFT_1624899 [Ramaria rubella]|nr:hypothetical protein K439DRAFT_1624899 [Ramaria rubella]
MANVYSHVSLPSARHNRLPTFLLYSRTHPLWPNGDSYIYEWDIGINEQKSYFQWTKSRSVEAIYEQDLDRAGEMRLYPGQAVFACDKDMSSILTIQTAKLLTSDADLKKDVIQAYVTDESTYPMGFKDNELLPACDRILGDVRERSSNRPKMVGGQLHGGTAFKRSQNRAHPVESSCTKTSIRAIFFTPNCSFGASALNLGVDDNIHFVAFQLNFSKCYKHGNAAALRQEMGFFGGMHVDAGGHPAYLSNLTVLSNLPHDYHPGVFMLYELGVYIRMDAYTGVNLSGLRLHVGTAPTAPFGKKPDPSAYRLCHVSYPPHCVMDMSSRQALGVLPGSNMLFNVPSNQANHIVDGVGLMTRQAHISFIVCMCLRVVQYITSQLPSSYNLHVDPTTFMQAFEFEREDGTSVSADSWKFGE